MRTLLFMILFSFFLPPPALAGMPAAACHSAAAHVGGTNIVNTPAIAAAIPHQLSDTSALIHEQEHSFANSMGKHMPGDCNHCQHCSGACPAISMVMAEFALASVVASRIETTSNANHVYRISRLDRPPRL